MALTLNSDIVAGVLKAAPSRTSGGPADRLAAGALPPRPATTPFEIEAAGIHCKEMISGRSGPLGRTAGEAEARDRGKITAFVEFESLLVRTMLEPVLPDERAQVFGSGLAGNMWRSMAAEQYASLFVSAGGLGLADKLAGFLQPEYSGARPESQPPLAAAGLE